MDVSFDDVLASLREQIGQLAQTVAMQVAQIKALEREAAENEQPDE